MWVYAASAPLAGYLGQHYNWRASFHLLGWGGILLAVALLGLLREPKRGASEEAPKIEGARSLWGGIAAVFRHPMAPVLMAVFVGANFVAAVFLTWLPSFLFRKFSLSLSMAGFSSTAYLQVASVLGVITGGALADRFARTRPAGRMMTQAIGLFAGIPFIFLTGWTTTVYAVVLAMTGFGFFKGLYDANIWASLYDVVPLERRATALGLMNSIGWLGGGVAPVVIAEMSGRWGMSASISAVSGVYLLVGVLLVVGIRKFMPATRS
jgi:predicted MFS family arabinose efflux permease